MNEIVIAGGVPALRAAHGTPMSIIANRRRQDAEFRDLARHGDGWPDHLLPEAKRVLATVGNSRSLRADKEKLEGALTARATPEEIAPMLALMIAAIPTATRATQSYAEWAMDLLTSTDVPISSEVMFATIAQVISKTQFQPTIATLIETANAVRSDVEQAMITIERLSRIRTEAAILVSEHDPTSQLIDDDDRW